MGIDTELQRLVEAVRRQPGSRAFALLAEHYLDIGRPQDARQVCQDGFTANPSYERGAIVFLRVLGELGDVGTAGQIYSQSIARHPRSAKLRTAWAQALLHAGHRTEARIRLLEAIDLDPSDREAHDQLAALEGDAAGAQTTRPVRRDPGAGRESEELLSQGLAAQLRPRVDPNGVAVPAHVRFDLTPAPVRVRLDTLTGGPRVTPSPFDVTPMPLDPVLTPSPLPTVEDTQTARAELDLPPLRPSVETEVEPEVEAAPAPQLPPSGGPDLLEQLPGFAEQPPVLELERPTSPARLAPQSRGARLAAAPTSRRRRGWIWLTVAVVALGTGGVIGYRAYRDHVIRREVARAFALSIPDLASSYREALGVLDRLLKRHPRDGRLLGASALLQAHLSARLHVDPGGRERSARWASEALARPTTGGAAHARLTQALLALGQGDVSRASSAVQALQPAEPLWHHRVTLAQVSIAQGQAEPAQAQLDGAAAGPAFPALLLEAGRLARLRGDLGRAESLLQRGLDASPAHPGLLVERARARLAAGTPPDVAEVDRLADAVASTPGFAANLSLLKGELAAAAGQRAAAREHAADAQRARPTDPEARWLAARWMLGPGGKVSAALAGLERDEPWRASFDPAARLLRARALILAGRPHDATDALARLETRNLTPSDRRAAQALQVQAAHLADDGARVEGLCAAPGFAEDPAVARACGEALLERSALGTANKLLATLPKSPAERYLRGLRAFTLGDHATAVRVLSALRPQEADEEPALPLLALGRALVRQHSLTEAVRVLRAAVTQDGRSARARLALAVALAAAGHDSEAGSLLDELVADRPTAPSLLAAAGQVFLALGNVQRADGLVRAASQRSPEATALMLLAGRVAQAEGQLDRARSLFKKVLNRDPRQAEALIDLGRAELEAKHVPKATQHFAAAVRLRPKDPELLLLQAEAYAKAGQYRQALKPGLQAIQAYVRSEQRGRAVEAMVTLGRAMRQGDAWARTRAQQLLFEATRQTQAPATAFLELGRVHRQNRNATRALVAFRQAIAHDPQLASAHLELGLTLRTRPAWRNQAKKALRDYLRLRPKGDEAVRVRALLARMK
ncbi:MAG: tetratricopeptide repeat protein [Deltaproteobacteria bacterium]|nr:tetratricopeptide repeat protein [Deltaproteobacteria bacterium]